MNARGAVLLLFEIRPEAIADHDDWHTHEHMPERLGISGFLRGTRWAGATAPGRYCVIYEVSALDVLDSAAYRDRLDHPTPWTTATMREYRGMRRTLCAIEAASGRGLGGIALVTTFAPLPARDDELHAWIAKDVLPALANRPGFATCWLLRNAVAASVTKEGQIRGRDATVHSALIVSGYDETAIAQASLNDLAAARFAEHGADLSDWRAETYRQAYSLSANDAPRPA
jgi:hypothetical protein